MALSPLAGPLASLLTKEGSIVIEIGNAWEPGAPIMSTLPLEALFAFKKAAKLNLCQHVICHNPARLPSPAAWVSVKRARFERLFHTRVVDVANRVSKGGQPSRPEPVRKRHEEAPEISELQLWRPAIGTCSLGKGVFSPIMAAR